jgi:chromosomal replication initiation ATPase DnaA
MIGTKEFVDRMRSTYMPDNFHNEIPQHRALGKSVDPEKVLEKAAGILNCDLDYIRHYRTIPKLIKEDRDLLVYLVWKICILSNEETGRLFGMTYSAISHILSSMRTRMQKDSDLRVKYNNIYSLCKM